MFTRKLGRSGVEISGLGLGCWAIGGTWTTNGRPDGPAVGWGPVDDRESIRAIRRALDLGISLFDTAALYGYGHSERVLGEALGADRRRAIVATKFGAHFDEVRGIMIDDDPHPEDARPACEASLRRLNTDWIDLYQLHTGACAPDVALAIRDAMEDLVREGKIRYYGWSTDQVEAARAFADGPHCTAIQHQLNVLEGDYAIVDLCRELGLASVSNSPLAKGLLTGKYGPDTSFSRDDIRGRRWNLKDGKESEQVRKLDQIRDALRSGGRTLAQGALGWIWARSEVSIPIPGFKTVTQVEENAGAVSFGPLGDEEMRQIDELLTDGRD